MLLLTDSGCRRHRRRQLKYSGPEARVMYHVFTNLPSEGDCHTYICDQGHTHHLQLGVPAEEIFTEAPHGLHPPIRLTGLGLALK